MSPSPNAFHVAGMNCIGPCAPDTDVPRMRPIPVSTRLTAARYCHGTPNVGLGLLVVAEQVGGGRWRDDAPRGNGVGDRAVHRPQLAARRQVALHVAVERGGDLGEHGCLDLGMQRHVSVRDLLHDPDLREATERCGRVTDRGLSGGDLGGEPDGVAAGRGGRLGRLEVSPIGSASVVVVGAVSSVASGTVVVVVADALVLVVAASSAPLPAAAGNDHGRDANRGDPPSRAPGHGEQSYGPTCCTCGTVVTRG